MNRRAVALGLGLALAVLELSSAGALWALAQGGIAFSPIPSADLRADQRAAVAKLAEGRTEYLAVDADLGWTIRPHGAAGLYHANGAGLRGAVEISPLPTAGRLRVAAFGDSFTHGDEVADTETWEAQIEARDPTMEVLNFGVPGYGPDQAWLRYQREAAAVAPEVVVLALVADDLPRLLNTFVPFRDPRTGLPMAKPRFVAAGQGLEPIPCGLPDPAAYAALLADPGPTLARLGARDAFYQAGPRASPWDALAPVRLLRMAQTQALAEDPLPILRALISRWSEATQAANQRFVVLLLPQREDLGSPNPEQEALKTWLEGQRIDVLDGRDAFPTVGDPARWFGVTHYTAEANGQVAALVASVLQEKG